MIDKKKELNNNIKEMLKEWGISEAFYVKVRVQDLNTIKLHYA